MNFNVRKTTTKTPTTRIKNASEIEVVYPKNFVTPGAAKYASGFNVQMLQSNGLVGILDKVLQGIIGVQIEANNAIEEVFTA